MISFNNEFECLLGKLIPDKLENVIVGIFQAADTDEVLRFLQKYSDKEVQISDKKPIRGTVTEQKSNSGLNLSEWATRFGVRMSD